MAIHEDSGSADTSPDQAPLRSARDDVVALTEAFAAISADRDAESVLDRIVESACTLTGAQYGALAVIGEGGKITGISTSGMDEPPTDQLDGLNLEPVANTLEQAGETLRLDDVSEHPLATGLQEIFPQVGTLLMVPIRIRGSLFGQLLLTGKAEQPGFDQQDQRLVESLASVAGIVIDNARAFSLSVQRRRWLEALSELTEKLAPPIDMGAALKPISASVRQAAQARWAGVVQVPSEGDPFVAVADGDDLDLSPAAQGIFRETARRVSATGSVSEVPLSDEWVVVMAPLRAHLTDPGVLAVVHPEAGHPEEAEERRLLSSFADQAGLAIDRAQALADREQLAVVSDRDRIARELHDVVIQRMFAMGLQLQAIRSAVETPELKERVDGFVTELDQTIRDIRGTIFGLQAKPQNTLRTEVREAVRAMVPMLGFAPSVQTEGPVDTPIDAKLQQQLVAVLREALANVARHAQAGMASVELQVTSTRLVLRVTDNGLGMPENYSERSLRGLRRRAALLGGNVDLWPGDPTGTVLVWQVPHDPSAN